MGSGGIIEDVEVQSVTRECEITQKGSINKTKVTGNGGVKRSVIACLVDRVETVHMESILWGTTTTDEDSL